MSKIKSFKQTSDLPYDRHDYKLVFTDGKKVIFDNYEDVQVNWFQLPPDILSHVEVLDKKPKKEKTQGFK